MKPKRQYLTEFPASSELRMFEDAELRQTILDALRQDIESQGLDASCVDIGPMMSSRFEVGSETDLMNCSGSGVEVQIILDEEPVGTLSYVPRGWSYGFRFGRAGMMLSLLDMVGDKEPGFHYERFNADIYQGKS